MLSRRPPTDGVRIAELHQTISLTAELYLTPVGWYATHGELKEGPFASAQEAMFGLAVVVRDLIEGEVERRGK